MKLSSAPRSTTDSILLAGYCAGPFLGTAVIIAGALCGAGWAVYAGLLLIVLAVVAVLALNVREDRRRSAARYEQPRTALPAPARNP